MYQLTISFETKEELISYLQGGVETSIPATSTVDIKAPARSRARPAAKPTEAVVAPTVVADMPLSSAPIAAPQASVAATPSMPAQVGVNRDVAIEEVRTITNALKTKCNLSDGVVQNIFAEIHVGLGTTGKKVSELEDVKLFSFLAAYRTKANTFFSTAQPVQQANASSFI